MKALRPVGVVGLDSVGHAFELRAKVFGIWWPIARTESRYEGIVGTAKGGVLERLARRLPEGGWGLR